MQRPLGKIEELLPQFLNLLLQHQHLFLLQNQHLLQRKPLHQHQHLLPQQPLLFLLDLLQQK
jgi:hypothetical protein